MYSLNNASILWLTSIMAKLFSIASIALLCLISPVIKQSHPKFLASISSLAPAPPTMPTFFIFLEGLPTTLAPGSFSFSNNI